MKDKSWVYTQPEAKNQSPWRWVILALGCLMMIGPYYCFDIPAALKTQLENHMGNPSDYEVQFNLLYTLYATPNVILPFFGGYLVDRLGVKTCLLIFAGCITLGQAVFAMGVSAKSWILMDLGNIIMGLGGESYTVANSALLSEWFKGAELAFAFGVNLSLAKLGSVINDVSSPKLAEDVNIVFAFWFGVFLCATAIASILIVFPIDMMVTRQTEQNRNLRYQLIEKSESGEDIDVKDVNNPIVASAADEEEQPRSAISQSMHHSNELETVETQNLKSKESLQQVSFSDIFRFKFIFWILVASNFAIYGCVLPFNNISSSFLLERDYFKEPTEACELQHPNQCPSDMNQPNDYCPSSHWYQPPIPTNYTSEYPSLTTSDIDCTDNYWKNACATSEYCDRLTNAESVASVVMSIPYIISAVLSPIFGFFIDRYGMRAIIATIAPMILIVVHSLLGFTDITPIGLLVGQGLAYTGFASVLWPSIPLVVEEHITGLGFGIVMSVNNFACAIVPVLVSQIYMDNGDKYIPNVELLFVALASLGVVLGLYMNWYDFHHQNLLNGQWLFPAKKKFQFSDESTKKARI